MKKPYVVKIVMPDKTVVKKGITASSKFEAKDRVYFQLGYQAKQPDRTKYKVL